MRRYVYILWESACWIKHIIKRTTCNLITLYVKWWSRQYVWYWSFIIHQTLRQTNGFLVDYSTMTSLCYVQAIARNISLGKNVLLAIFGTVFSHHSNFNVLNATREINILIHIMGISWRRIVVIQLMAVDLIDEKFWLESDTNISDILNMCR